MFAINAYFWNNEVYINEKNKYAANEILTAYLNSDFLEDAENYLYELKCLNRKLLIDSDMDYENHMNFNANTETAKQYFSKINSVFRKLPPYEKYETSDFITFDDVLNNFQIFFEDGRNYSDNEIIDYDEISEYGFYENDEHGNPYFYMTKFELSDIDYLNYHAEQNKDDFFAFNNAINKYFKNYFDLLNSYIVIKKAFSIFTTDYLNRNSCFPDSNIIADCFTDFNREHGINFNTMKCRIKSFGYKVLSDKNNKSILCEKISFEDLESFIFYDFWNGIKHNYIPNQCKLCNRFFLIRGGKYLSYCDNPLKEDPSRTCRDAGARRSYEDKCKSDPVWQTYNRAYKAHYARYMKKKMTVAEFEEWSRFASEIRDKAIADKIEFDDYYKQIRK